MFIEVDATAKEPLYGQIRDQIVAGIATGELTVGMQLPSALRPAYQPPCFPS